MVLHFTSQVIFLLFWSSLFPLYGAQAEAGTRQAGSQLRVYAVTPITAPERAVYQVFAAEVVENERRSQDRSLPEEHRKVLSTKLQFVAAVQEDDYRALKSICADLIADLETNAKLGNDVLANSRLTKAERDAAIGELRARRDETIDGAIDRWKRQIGRRFRWVDQNIRAYIAPGLRVGYVDPVAAESKVGASK